jgi:hypothetical protein
MTTVFISGSMNIKNLDDLFIDRIAKIVKSGFDIVVGDADGADASVQTALLKMDATHVRVYCTGGRPRNNIGDWPVYKVASNAKEGSRAYYTAKDVEMAEVADYGLMMWDVASTGTLSNVIELLTRRKKSMVFASKHKKFINVVDVESVRELIEMMSDKARARAETKIALSSKINQMAHEQFRLAI